ncbi:MAG TPA: hypothetical protein DEB35_06140 [Desulfuromonas sp.]|nr:hypothetical protein [Desulfuromonas sp.]
MTTLIIVLYLAVLAASSGLHFLNNRHLQRHGDEVPSGFAGAVDAATLAQSSAYTLAKGQLGLVRSLFDSALTLLFVFGGLLAWYDGWLAGHQLSFIAAGLAFFLLLSLAQTLFGLPFDLYSHFKIESRFGFNRMSFKLWCADQAKGLLLSLLFFALLGTAAFWLIQAAPQSWWLWVWALLVGFGLLLMVIAPYVIEPLFFKFQPLQGEGLEEAIRVMLAKAGLPGEPRQPSSASALCVVLLHASHRRGAGGAVARAGGNGEAAIGRPGKRSGGE